VNKRVTYDAFHLLDSAQLWYHRLPNNLPTWEHFLLLIAARFEPQITLGNGSSAGDIQGGDDNLVASSGALFMGIDSGREEPRVGPHDLDACDTEVGDGGRNFLQTDGEGLAGTGTGATYRSTHGGILARAHLGAPSGSGKVVLCAVRSIVDLGVDDPGSDGAEAVAKGGSDACDLLAGSGRSDPL
jgi:hypothetical protein